MPNQTSGVLFDLDGVLVDSVAVNTEAYEIAFYEAGCTFGESARAAVALGKPRRVVIEAALDESQQHLAEILFESKEAALVELLRRRTDVGAPGAVDTVRGLRARGVRLGVVTNSCAPELWLRAAGIEDAFSAIVTGADVSQPKPDPSGYRLGTERLGVPPASCIAIEDTEDGWRAARGAGLRTLVVARGRPPWATPEIPVVERLAVGHVEALLRDLTGPNRRSDGGSTENDNSSTPPSR